MEKTVEELQVDLQIAEAKIELLFKYVGYLCDELNRSGVINWNQYDLRRQLLSDFEANDAHEEAARMDLEFPDEDGVGVSAAQAVDFASDHIKRMSSIRKEIAKQIRHGEA